MSHYNDYKDRIEAKAMDDAAVILPLLLAEIIGDELVTDYNGYLSRRNFKGAALEAARLLDGYVDSVSLEEYQHHVHAGRLMIAAILLCDVFEGRLGVVSPQAVEPVPPSPTPEPVPPHEDFFSPSYA